MLSPLDQGTLLSPFGLAEYSKVALRDSQGEATKGNTSRFSLPPPGRLLSEATEL